VFESALVNLYTGGFTETFRTPTEGAPAHVELRLDGFTLGLGTVEAAASAHDVEAPTGRSSRS
jgi:lactoylglutathione lyase